MFCEGSRSFAENYSPPHHGHRNLPASSGLPATIGALVTVGFSFDDEPRANSKGKSTVATSGPHNLRRRSNCNLCACTKCRGPNNTGPRYGCATRSPSRGRACPTLLGWAAMYTEGTASRPPTAKSLADIGVQENEIRARAGSRRWMEGFSLKDSPPLWKARKQAGGRWPSRPRGHERAAWGANPSHPPGSSR